MFENAPPQADTGATPETARSFEDALEALHRIVTELETGSLTLDDTISKFQEGSALAAECLRRIEIAELRVTELATAADDVSGSVTSPRDEPA